MNERINREMLEVNKEITDCKAKIEADVKYLDQRGVPIFNVPDSDATKRELLFYENKLEMAQRRFTSLLLEALNDATDKLDSSVTSLNTSSESQLETTRNLLETSARHAQTTARLEKSSGRLELLTTALILLTSILILFSADPFFLQVFKDEGLSSQSAFLYANLLTILIVVVVYVPLLLIVRYRRDIHRES